MIPLANTNESAHNWLFTWVFTEWMHCDEPLFTTNCHSSTSPPVFLSQSRWQAVTGQSKVKYKLHHLPVESMECKKRKSNHLKYTLFGAVYRLETFYSPFLHSWKNLRKSYIWLTVWLEGLLNKWVLLDL